MPPGRPGKTWQARCVSSGLVQFCSQSSGRYWTSIAVSIPRFIPTFNLMTASATGLKIVSMSGFRLGNPPEEGLIARRLFPMQLVICAAPTYLRKYGVPQNLYELDAHRCSGFRRPSDGRVAPWRVRVGDSLQEQNIRPSFSTNDEAFELRAVLAGEVIGQLAVPTVATLIRSGRLVPLLLEHMTDHLSLFVYYGSRAAQPARVRCFIDLVVARLTESNDVVLSDHALREAHAKGMACC